MNTTSPRSISLYCALIIGIFSLLTYFLSCLYLGDAQAWWPGLLVAFGSAVLTYFLVMYFVERFIHGKIRLIYKTIHNLKTQQGQEINLNMNEDILKKVNRDVMDWADSQKKEIKKLKEKETFRREFIGNLSHELKTPTFAIQGYLLTLLEGGMADPKISLSFLERAAKSVDRMVNLIEDLDSIGQLESGEIKVELHKFNIVDLAKETIETFEMKARDRGIKVHFDKKYDKPIFVSGDSLRIGQVFSNLLVNSINYGKDDGETEIRFFDMDEVILVEVADNGIGIDRGNLSRIFERFYRADKSRSRHVGGSGLGLAICKHIMDAHKQTINVRSTLGVGSTFSFTLQKA